MLNTRAKRWRCYTKAPVRALIGADLLRVFVGDFGLILGTRLGIVLAVLGGAGAIALLATAPLWHGGARASLFSDLFRFSVTTVLAGGFALIYTAVQNRRAAINEAAETKRRQAEDRRRRLESFLAESVSAYNDLKFVRRELRRNLRGDEQDKLWMEEATYARLMRALNRSALRLEEIERTLLTRPAHLRGMSDVAVERIREAERYVPEVCKEYENKALPVASDQARVLVGPASRLFQYAVSSNNPHRDGAVREKHFRPLEDFFEDAVRLLDAA